ncbi:MAG: winged helix-turn-helix transcriptional regulator [Candidatus Aenigmarchaeota archaeon]|nr:winged helix-turn-helix transcriptional regulator [Candidatus Aenigmarchaeota archaeon]
MNKIALRLMEPIDERNDVDIITRFMPEIGDICSNQTRAGILHLMINTPQTMHSLKVEEICFKLGIRQSVAIHHLEKLEDWKLVEVKKFQEYGTKTRRSIWGLNLKHPHWISECYKSVRAHFFSEKELAQITNIDKSLRFCS